MTTDTSDPAASRPAFLQVELEGFCANAKVCAVGVSPVVFLSRLFSAFRPTRASLSDFQSPLLDASSFAT